VRILLVYGLLSTVCAGLTLLFNRRLSLEWRETVLWAALVVPLIAIALPRAVHVLPPIAVTVPTVLTGALPLTITTGRAPNMIVAVAIALWLSVAVLLLVRELWRRRRLLSLLDRRPINGSPLAELARSIAAELGLARPIRVTQSTALQIPIAIGSSEVCVPPHVSLADRRPALAHEIAHLRRFDTYREQLARLVALVFWWQPLNRLLVRELTGVAELLADRQARRAVAGEDLAATLLRFAEQSLEQRFIAGAPALHASPLRERILRLLQHEPGYVSHRFVRVSFVILCLPLASVLPAMTIAPKPVASVPASRDMGSPSDEDVVAALRALLRDPSKQVREAARASLTRFTSREPR
jgi:beta-lactamase regulating signal transducer with metallopeptidase domain